MRSSKRVPEPTAVEFDVLKILWKAGKLSTREVHERLRASYPWAYSTTRTTMERMAKKGLLVKAEFHGVNLYEPAASKPVALARMVKDFAERVLELDSGALVPLFVWSKGLTRQEVEELSRLIVDDRGKRKR